MITPSSNTQSNAQGSFGAMLQQARKSKQVSLDDVSSELFILKRHLLALENENFTDLPQAAFARGFAINYAKYLGLDPIKIATSFDAAYPNELKPHTISNVESPLRPMGTLNRDSKSRIRFNPMLILAVIGLIILIIFLFKMVTNVSNDDSQDDMPLVEDISAAEQAQGAAIDDPNGVGASGSALNLGGDSSVSAATLQVKVTGDTTVNIYDSTGTGLLNGEQVSGNYRVSGTPPFNVQIDNVSNVTMTLNEQDVTLQNYASGNQASFELSP